MASRSRTFTSTRTKTSTSNPTRVQIQPPATADDGNTDGDVKCAGHQMKCTKLKAGPTTKNAGRAFYCCPLPREDPKRCGFFKWHDEIFPTSSGSKPAGRSDMYVGSSRAASLVAQTNAAGPRTLGQSPQARYGKPEVQTTPSSSRAGPTTLHPKSPIMIEDDDDEEGDEMEEIDWDKVDADEMEREAIASTPSSQRPSQTTPSTTRSTTHTYDVEASTSGPSLTDRLRGVVDVESPGKRKRNDEENGEDDNLRTPKRVPDDSNPFLSTTPATPGTVRSTSAPHNLLSPTLMSLEQLSEHLHRQDRLLRAAESMKQGMRGTIKSLQEKNAALEEKVKELEKQLRNK